MATRQQALHPLASGQETTLVGLTSEEAARLRAVGMHNDVPLTSSRSYAQIIRDNVFLSINVIIFTIGFALVLMGLYMDAVLTAGLVAINVVISVIQEIRAKHALDKITLLSRMRATVVRDGEERRVGPEEIVLGDVVVAEPGDQVMVDGRVLSRDAVELDQSLITGESDPVPIGHGDTVLSGSFCLSGRLAYEATRVGRESTMARMTEETRRFEARKTPLQRDIDLVLRVMVIVMLVLGGPIALDLLIRLLGIASSTLGGPLGKHLGRAYQAYSAQENVQAIAIVAGLVPQGLALMLTVTYAMGAVRLAGQRALLQQASGMESLSHVDVVCFDKTGTLTTNRLAFHRLAPLAARTEHFASALGDLAASTASPNRTIDAIRDAFPAERRPLRDAVAFSSARKWSGLSFADGDRETLILGAPEVILPHVANPDDVARALAEWLPQGLRVLLLASASSLDEIDDESTSESDMVALGLVSFTDELNADAIATIEAFHRDNIEIKIISGDHPEAVAAIARRAGLDGGQEPRIISGLELATMDDGALADAADEHQIFGRVTPEQKVRLVEAMQRRGHYVAMVGDGVNDALAVKRAQVGVAMEYGSQATRAVADLVLLGNAFTALPAALQEGRRIVRASHDMMKLFLTRSLAMVIAILSAGIISAAFPFIPTHNFLPAFLTVGVPTFFIAAWARPGPDRAGGMQDVLAFVVPAALTAGVLQAVVYISYLRATSDVLLARTVVITVAVLTGLLLILFTEPPTENWAGGDRLNGDRRIFILVLILTVLFLAILLSDDGQTVFDLAPLSAVELLTIALLVAAWGRAIRAAWRHHLLRRLLGVQSPS